MTDRRAAVSQFQTWRLSDPLLPHQCGQTGINDCTVTAASTTSLRVLRKTRLECHVSSELSVRVCECVCSGVCVCVERCVSQVSGA